MASIIAYYRPRGIQGNFKVGILLDLLLTETADVYREKKSIASALSLDPNENKGFSVDVSQLVRPQQTALKKSLFGKDQGKFILYILTPFSGSDVFHIVVKDKEITGSQSDYYIAEFKAIRKVEFSEFSSNLRWRSLGEEHGLVLNTITLIDLDNAETAILQKYKSEIQQLRQYL